MSGSYLLACLRRLPRIFRTIVAWMLRPQPKEQQRPMRHLRLIQLEDRRVLNASLALGAGIELTGGEELLVQDGGTDDLGGGDVQTVDLTISNGTWTVDSGIDASLYDIVDGGKTLRVDQSLIDDGGAALDAEGQLLIQGSDAATDDVTINVDGLDFIPSAGIVFAGGEDPAASDNDSLTVTGYSLTTADGEADVTVTHTGAESGSVELDGIGTVEFDEIEPLTLGGTAADLVIQLPAGADDNVVLSDDGSPGDGVSQIASPTNGAFETTTFMNPTNSLTVLDGSGVKTINVWSLDSLYAADLTVDTDSDDSLVFTGGPTDLGGGNLTADAGTIDVFSAINASGTGSVSLTADENILIHTAASINVVDGDATLTANQGPTIAPGDFVGIRMQTNSSITTTGTGNILLTGRGGDDAAATFQAGIFLASDASITSSKSAADAGTITLIGTGGIGASSDQTGVQLSGALISSEFGDIHLQGTGGTGTPGFDNGVYLVNDAMVKSTGMGPDAAAITIHGAGGNGAGLNLGVGIVDEATVQTVDGDISITGIGGTGVEDINVGVALYDSALIKSEGTGTITVMGTGGGQGASKENFGVSIAASSSITSQTADISITGVAGTGASYGVVVDELDPRVPGSFVPLAGHVLSTGAADITITATGSGGLDDFRAGTDAVIGGPSSTGNITFNVDTISLDDTGSVSIEADGELLITPRTASTTIGIGGGSGTLNLTSGELLVLKDGFSLITIGDSSAGTGDVDIDSSQFSDSVAIFGGSISVTEMDVAGNTVSLTARTGAITDGGDGGVDVTADSAAFRAVTGIGASNSIETDLMTVAFSNSTSGQVRISDTSGSLAIDDVDGLMSSSLSAGSTISSSGAMSIDHSVSDAGSGVTTFISGGHLDINATVSTADADLKFSSDGNTTVDAAVSSTTGNILFVATGTLSQTAAITAQGLGLMVDGTTTLTDSGNDVTDFAAANGDQTVYRDSDSLTITTVTVDSMMVTGASATSGNMQVTTDEGSLTVAESVTATDGNILLTSGDSSDAGDDLTVNSVATVKSDTGNVTLRGGDDVTVTSGSTVDAADTVSISGDFGNADDAGSNVAVQGTIKSVNTAQISGEADNDVITLDPDAGSSGAADLKGQGGDDSYNVQLGELGGTVSVDEQAAEGSDDLTITDDAGVAETFTVGSTQTTTTTGGETVTYSANLEQVSVEGEDEADTFDVTASSTATIDIKGGTPTSPASPGDQITFTTPVSETSTLTQDGADGGTFATTGGFEDVTFDEIETLNLSGSVNITGTSGDDLVVLTATSANSGTLQITTDGVVGPVIHLTDVTEFSFDGMGGDDILRIVNPAGGLFNPADGITFDGGTGGEGNIPGSGDNPTGDALEILGGTATSVEHVFVNNSEGSVFYDGEAVATISYEGLEPVTDTITATTRTFTFTGGAETIDLANDAGAGQMTIDSTLGESVTFANPTGQLTINAGTGDDIININSMDAAYRAALTVNGDSHTAAGDTVNLGTDLTLGSAGSTGDLLIDAETIVLTSNVVIDTTDGGSNGNVQLTGTLNADAAAANRTLQVTAGTGTVDFQGAIGATEALESLTVVSASTVDLPSVMTRDGGISITAGTINLNDTLYDTTDETTAGTVTFNGTTVLNANVMVNTDTSTDASVTFNGLVRADNISNDRTLDVTAGTGIVEFTDQIGNGHNLADLDIAASTIILGGNVAVDAFSAGADGVITLDGDVQLQNSLVNIDLDDGSAATAAYSLVITGNLNADNAANDRRFSVFARGGTIDFQGQIGNTQAIDDLDVTDNNTPTTIRFGGDVTVDGATGNHIVLLDGNVVVDNDVTFHLDGAVDKTLTVTGTLDADAAASTRAVVFRTGTADINVNAAVGATEQLGSLTIANAADATFDSTIAAGSLTQTTGTGTTTFNGGTISGSLDVSTANVTFASGTMAVSGTATVTAATAIAGGTDDGVADLTATVITLLTGTGGIGTGTTSLDLSASTRLDASTTAAGADYFIDGIGALKLGQVNAGTGTAVLSATTGIEDARLGEGSGDENIIASATALRATTGIGSADDIDTAVSTLAFTNSTSGQVHIINTGGLTINDVDGIMTSTSIGGGSITANSPLTISHDVTVNADMDFVAGDSPSVDDDLTIDTGATVTLDSATDATLKFVAGDDVILHSDATPRIVTTGAAHTVHITADKEGALDADRGSITQTGTDVTIARMTGTLDLHAQAFDGIGSPATPLKTTVDSITASTTGTGPINIVETNAVTLTDVDTADGTIDVTAGGQIVATDVDAGGAGSDVNLMTTAGGIEATDVVAADAVILDADTGDINLGKVEATAGSINITADMGAINDQQDDLVAPADLTAGTTITLTARDEIGGISPAGSITDADGKIEVAAGSSVTAHSTNAGDIRLRGLGAITLTDVDTASGSIDVMAAGQITATDVDAGNTGDVTLMTSSGDVVVDSVSASGDSITILSAAAITEAGAGDAGVDLNAADIRLVASSGIGTTGAIEIDATNLAASTVSGDICLTDINGLTITTIDSTVGVQITGDAAGDDIVLTTGGTLTVNSVVSNAGAGNIRLDGDAATADVVINAAVTSGTGHVTIVAGDDVDQNADIGTTGGSILVTAANQTSDGLSGIDMAEGTKTSTGSATGGNIHLAATGEGDVRLGLVEAGSGSVSIEAQGSILDNNDQTTAGTLNVTAAALRMIADSDGGGLGSIGTSDLANSDTTANRHAIDTKVTTVAARSATGIYLQESDAVSVDATGDIGVTQVNADKSTTVVTASSLADLETTHDGPIKVITLDGTLTINGGGDADTHGVQANGVGNLLLESRGTAADVDINSDVVSGEGHISVIAADDIELSADVQTTGAGTVVLSAGNNSVEGSPTDGINITSGTIMAGGDVALVTTGESDLVLQSITTTGDVLLSAEGSIVDGNGAAVNVTASGLILIADSDSDQNGMVGGPDGAAGLPANSNAIDTQVTTIAASAADGIYIQESDGDLTIDTVTVNTVQVRFRSDTTSAESSLSDLTTTDSDNGAPIKVVNSDGNITVNGGTLDSDSADNVGVSAAGSGNVLLDAHPAGADLILDADVLSGSGHITLLAADRLEIGHLVNDTSALVETSGSGSIVVEAGTGAVEMQDNSRLKSQNGNIRVQGGTDVIVGRIESTSTNATPAASDSNVAITAVAGSILDADPTGDSTVDITAEGLRLNAAVGVGEFGGMANPLETSVTTLSARATSGGINITESDDVVVDDVTVMTTQTAFDSGTNAVTDATQSDLRTTAGNGDIQLTSLTGTITLNEGTAAAGDGSVAAHGSGRVDLTAETGDIIVNADITSGTGSIDLTGDAISQNADISTASTGTIDLTADNGSITMADGTTTTSGAGAITYDATANVALSLLTSTSGQLNVTADSDLNGSGSITDNTAGEAANLVTSTTAVLSAAEGIGGTGDNDLDTTIATLQATNSTSGDIIIQETSGLTVGGTGVSNSGGHIKLTVSSGDLDIDADVTAPGNTVFLAVAGNVTQQMNDDITAENLALMVDGTTRLDNPGNNVTNFAAMNGGQTVYRDADTLNIESITLDGMTVTGIKTSDDDVKLIVDTGNLDIDEAISLGTANLFLDVTGNVTQQANDDITAGGLALMVDGTTRLDNAGNNVTNFAAMNGGQTVYRDAGTLNIEEITVDGMTVNGIKTSDDDVKLIVDTDNLDIDENIALGSGDLFLDVAGNVTQQPGDNITAAGLGLMVDGTTVLDNPGNDVDTLAANNGGATTYRDADTLTVETVTVDGMTVTGITTTSDDVTLNVLVGNLNINEAVTTQGGSLTANAAAAINSSSTGTITTTGTVADQDSGSVQLTAGTDVALAGAVDTSGFDNAADGQNSDGGSVTITATTGSIAVDDITSSGGDVATGTGGNAGLITLDAATTITLNDNPAVSDPADGDLSSAGGTDLSTGVRTGDGADLIFQDPVILAADEPTDGETQTINTSGATAGDVIFQQTLDGATPGANDLTINARDTDVSNAADPTSGNVTFMMEVGGATRLGDLTITDADNVHAMQRIRATSLTQLAGIGNTTLNEVDIETVTAGPSSAIDITTDYTINLRGNITVTDATGTVDNTTATGETIAVTSVDGNVIIEDGVVVSTDEDPAPGHSSEFTGDSIMITADVPDDPGDLASTTARRSYTAAERDSDADGIADDVDPDLDGDGIPDIDPADENVPVKGLFKAGPNTELRTDGGVAKRFPPLLEPTGLIEATTLNETSDQVFFRSEWEVETGVEGEENLRVNVDWRDPIDEPDTFPDTVSGNPVTSQRQQTFLVRDDPNGVNPDRETFGHVYSNLDSVEFVSAEVPEYEVDFSVAHHESIVVMGSHLDQSPLTDPQTVPSGVITTTDDPATGTGVADPTTDVTDPIDSNLDLHFESGLLEVKIPTEIGFVPPVDPERPVPVPERAAIAPLPEAAIQQFVPDEIIDAATSSYSSQSEDYFQLRQNSTDPVEGFERIDPDVGWKLLQPRRLKEWVYANDLDGSGYELWLITTKIKDGQDITFERPVLRFDVFDNQPFPGAEELLDQLPELELKRLKFNADGSLSDTTEEAAGTEETDGAETGAGARLDSRPANDTESDGQTDTGNSNDQPADGVARSAITGLAVTAALTRTRKYSRLSSHLSAVSRILNRTGE